MTFAEYLAIPAVNWSSLSHMEDSPLHYRYHRDHGSPETPQKALGRYVHAAVLAPHTLDRDFAIWTEGRRAGKAFDAFAAANEGKTIFRQCDIDDMQPIIDALRNHPDVADLVSNGECEQPIMWYDIESEADCKGRPDLKIRSRRIVADLKTARSIDVRRFGHDVQRYGYHKQLSFYADGIAASEGWTPAEHLLIVVESNPPHDVAVFPLSESTIAVGREAVRGLLTQLRECHHNNRWPGRYPERQPLDETNLPPWLYGGGVPEFAFAEE